MHPLDDNHETNAKIPAFPSWKCKACTWVNENPHGLACLMCQSERRCVDLNYTNRYGGSSALGMTDAPSATAIETAAATDEPSPLNDSTTTSSLTSTKLAPVSTYFTSGEDNDGRACMNSSSRLENLKNDHNVRNLNQSNHKAIEFGMDEPPSLPIPRKECEDSSNLKLGDVGSFQNEPPFQESVAKLKTEETQSHQTIESKSGNQWDAFASFQANYRSSDDGEDCGSRDDGSEEDSQSASDDESENDGQNCEWDAFKSFQENYQSSEEDYEEGESCDDENDCDNGDHERKERQSFLSSNHGISKPECVDLADTDDEADINNARIKWNGKENISNSPSSKQKQSITQGKRIQKLNQPIALNKSKIPISLVADSDSSLSEVECKRPHRSPSSSRPLPSWQRSTRSSTTPPLLARKGPITGINSARSFSCMSHRNDVVGGSGAGVNGFTVCSRKGDDLEEGAKDSKKSGKASTKQKARASKTSRTTSTKPSAASGTRKRKASTSSSSTATKARKRKTSTSTAASSNAASTTAPAKKRRRKHYRRSASKRGGSSSNTRASTSRSRRTSSSSTGRNNDAWSARERGIRQPYRRSTGGGASSSSAPYMNIVKQEPMLRSIGGASITF